MNQIFNFLEFYVFINEKELGKMDFPLGKMECLMNWEFCLYHRKFRLRKDRAGQIIFKSKTVYK